MASYYTSQAYDVDSAMIWPILTDFSSWPLWFPNMATLDFEDGHSAGPGARLRALAGDRRGWSRWRIIDWKHAELLVCEFEETNTVFANQVDNAYLQFALADDPEGCMLEVEVGAEGAGLMSDFLVGTTLGVSARRMLPRLVDAFSEHVVERVRGPA